MRMSRRARFAAPLVITVAAGMAGCTPAPGPATNPPYVDPPINPPGPPVTAAPAQPPEMPPHQEPLHVNPPPRQRPLPPATDPSRVQTRADGTCWETNHGNPPMTQPVLCPTK